MMCFIKRIANAFEKCVYILKFTKSAFRACKLRKKFPRNEAVIFSRDLSEMVETLNQIMGHDFLIAKQLCSSMICIASQLSNGKENGIEAFTNLISALQWTIQTIIAQRQEILLILEENLELRKKIDKLEQDLYTSNDQVDQDLQEYKSEGLVVAIKSELKGAFSATNTNEIFEEPTDEMSFLNISESEDFYAGKHSAADGEYIRIKRIDLLREFERAILRTTQSKFEVLDVYIGVSSPPADPEERLVVIYDCYDATNPDSDASSIESLFITWLPSSRRTSDQYCNYIDEMNWLQFRQEQQPEFRALLADFFDSACADLMKEHSDVAAVFPSVYRVLNEGPFDPVLCILKKSLRFHPFGEEPILLGDNKDGLYLTLRSGKQVKVVIKEGWIEVDQMSKKNSNNKQTSKFQGQPITSAAITNPSPRKGLVSFSMGDGISLVGLDETYGTIGGFVKKEGKFYAVTNEHVVAKAMKERDVKSFMKADLTFRSPSIGAKAMQLKRDGEIAANTATGGGGLFSFLMKAHNNLSLKQILSPHPYTQSQKKGAPSHPPNPQITLTEVRDFLYSGQNDFSTEYDSIQFFNTDLQANITLCSEPITISGDVALIPMPNGLKEKESSGRTVMMLTLNDMINSWQKDKGNLKVYKIGATTGLTTGEITRPIHINKPIPTTDQLIVKHPTSKILSNRITLLNQIIVSAFKFGDSGDSGSLVYYDSDPADMTSVIYAVGTFLGKLDKADHLFIVTPSSDFFVNNKFEFARTELASSS